MVTVLVAPSEAEPEPEQNSGGITGRISGAFSALERPMKASGLVASYQTYMGYLGALWVLHLHKATARNKKGDSKHNQRPLVTPTQWRFSSDALGR